MRHPHQPTPGTLGRLISFLPLPPRVPETPLLLACKKEMCWDFQRQIPSRGLCSVCGHSLLLCTYPAFRRQQSPSQPWAGGRRSRVSFARPQEGWWGIPAMGALAEEGFARPDSYSSFRAREKLVLAPH